MNRRTSSVQHPKRAREPQAEQRERGFVRRQQSDPWGRAHDVPNPRTCDDSVFPAALATNPALTIIALSSRTADRVLGRS